MIATAGIFLLFFGIVTIAGGVMGFVKAKSKASIIAGTISGALLIGAGVLARQGNRAGLYLGIVVALALLGRFGAAFAKTRAIAPAGVMTLLSVMAIAIAVGALF